MEHIKERIADFETFKKGKRDRNNMLHYSVKYFVMEGVFGNHDRKESMIM